MNSNTQNIIEYLFEKFGAEKTDKLTAYLDLVLERNEHINLTAVRDRDEAFIKHVADSLFITELAEYKRADTVLDVGTGAGFPGALLAIVNPEKQFVLLDSTRKRLRVIDEFADTLGIENITTLHARAEEINRKAPHKEAYDLCVSRAVANLDTLSSWCLPFVKKGGCFISYKGGNYADELSLAGKTIRRNSCSFDRAVKYPDTYPEISGHVLLVISRT